MNILFLTTHLNFGGITSYVLNLASELKKQGHNVFVASSGGDLVLRFLSEDVEHIQLNIRTKSEISSKIIFSYFKLRRVIKEKKIQVIHSHTRVTQVLSYLLSRSLSKPFVTTCHGYFKLRLNRRIFPCWGDRVIAISEPVRTHLIDDFKVNLDKLRLVYNGVRIESQLEYPKENIKKRLGLKNGPVIGMIARLSPVKGHKHLIMAMKEVICIEPKAQLLIVGDGPLKNDLLSLINEAGIKSNTILAPSTENIGEIFSVMSVCVSPSLQEGLGLSVIEAQANYVPAVAFRIGGITDVIEDEITGLLVEPFNEMALASAIMRLLKDKELFLKIKEAAYRSAERKFSVAIMAKKILNIYKEVLK